jgi:hypothetical protein
LQQSYANGNKNFTVRFWDQLWSVTVADTVADNAGLNVGNTGTPYGGLFEDREGSRGTANYPYLNVTYTPKPFYTNITNPVTINLAKGESRNVLFWVNPTGHVGEFYNFSATANLTSNPAINDTTDNAEIEIGSPI